MRTNPYFRTIMRANPYLIAVCLSFCAGCHPAVHSHLGVTPALTGSPSQTEGVVSIVRPILQANGFSELRTTNQSPSSAMIFTDGPAGGDRHTWVYITCRDGGWPMSLHFMDQPAYRRSDKHMKLVAEVEAALKQHDFQVER
jgi:hypothetical protein